MPVISKIENQLLVIAFSSAEQLSPGIVSDDIWY